MAHTKAGGSTTNLRDSNPKYLGVKRADGQKVKTGEIIVRQRGTMVRPGANVGLGKDHTIFAIADGTAKFRSERKGNFDGTTTRRRVVDVVTA